MEIRRNVLLLLDANMPKTLGAFCGLGGRRMVVAFVGVGLRNAEGKEGEREKFEDLGGRKGRRKCRKAGVFLLAGSGIGRRLDGAKSTLDCRVWLLASIVWF